MADSFFGNVIEFLLGFIILPMFVRLIWMFGVPLLGLGGTLAIILKLVLNTIIFIIAIKLKKMIGIGFLVGAIIEFIAGYLSLF